MIDIIDLRDFYSRPLGSVVRRILRVKLASYWRHGTGLRVLGYGYATPYLNLFQEEAERVCAFMPAAQGVIGWPTEAPIQSGLIEPDMWPLRDSMMDRILMIHGLENADNAMDLLREAWRCLAPGGKLLAVVPSRRGVWSRLEQTPFGHGRPFSKTQLTQLLRNAAFTPDSWSEALLFPPVEKGLVLRSAVTLERLGARFWPLFAGLHVVEASKQVYRPLPVRVPRKVRLPSPSSVLKPTGVPVPSGRNIVE